MSGGSNPLKFNDPFHFTTIRSQMEKLAESEGFEPPDPCGSTVFKTAALNRSATSPEFEVEPYCTRPWCVGQLDQAALRFQLRLLGPEHAVLGMPVRRRERPLNVHDYSTSPMLALRRRNDTLRKATNFSRPSAKNKYIHRLVVPIRFTRLLQNL